MQHPDMEIGGSSSTIPPTRAPLKKGPWSEDEDLLLTRYIEKYGPRNWARVPSRAGLNRCRKSCRLRWLNYLQPSNKRGEFEPDEVDLISRMHNLLGNRWSLIARRIPGRTANDIKNYYNTHFLKKISRKLPRPNITTIDDNHTMMTSKVSKPVPRKISEKSLSVTNKASTTTWLNITNNLTSTRFLETNNKRSTNKSKEEETAKHEGLKFLNKNGSSDEYLCNFDANQGVEECANVGENGNCWYNDLYLGDDLWSMLQREDQDGPLIDHLITK